MESSEKSAIVNCWRIGRKVRAKIQSYLSDDHPDSLKHDNVLLKEAMVDMSKVQMMLPCRMGVVP